MPLYDYQCPAGHRHERLRRYEHRDLAVPCLDCDQEATRIPSAHHAPPDGVYSYAPNIGDPSEFERRNEDAREFTRQAKER